MKSPVVLQSSRAFVDLVSCVSVVWSWIGRLSDRLLGVVASVNSQGNLFSQFRHLILSVGGFLGMTGGFSVSKMSSISSTSRQAYRLSLCSRGMPLICCSSKNLTHFRILLLPFSLSLPCPLLMLDFATILPFPRRAYIECRIGICSPLPNVRLFCNADRCQACRVSFGLHQCPSVLDFAALGPSMV
jgi:hypothetical protein